MTHQVYGYMHLDYSDENLDRRVETFGSATIVCDYGPRNDTARVNLNRLLAETQAGDFIYVDSIDRIADSVSDFYDLLKFLKARGVGFEALDDAFILKPATDSEGSAAKRKNPWNVPALDETLELIGRMAELERATTNRGPRGFAFDFVAAQETLPLLTLEQVLGAEQQLAAGLPLARIATSLRVCVVELFKAMRRDNEYATYLKM
ncbi:recombinase family protein [Leucobacter sp. 1207-22]|uniref:recombinase family protein n=1 Tax=Leucobacter sp. 1207-22 TaxID=2604456 RepID=UPI0040646E0A